jgi:hypothetical protein
VPSNERVWFHNRQETTPFDELRQGDERDAGRIIRTVWLYLPFEIQRQLLAQEQVLRGELGT